MEEVNIWIARDANGDLYGYLKKPEKHGLCWDGDLYECYNMPYEYFPSVKWEDKEPTKAKITLIK